MHVDLRLQIVHVLPHVQKLLAVLYPIGQVVRASAPLPFVGARPTPGLVGCSVPQRVAAAGEQAALCAGAGYGVGHPSCCQRVQE